MTDFDVPRPRNLGLVALIIGAVPILLIVIEIIVSLTTTGPDTSQGGLWLLVVLGVFGAPILALVALVLGIVSVVARRGRGYGIVAIVLAAIEILYGALGVIGASGGFGP